MTKNRYRARENAAKREKRELNLKEMAASLQKPMPEAFPEPWPPLQQGTQDARHHFLPERPLANLVELLIFADFITKGEM